MNTYGYFTPVSSVDIFSANKNVSDPMKGVRYRKRDPPMNSILHQQHQQQNASSSLPSSSSSSVASIKPLRMMNSTDVLMGNNRALQQQPQHQTKETVSIFVKAQPIPTSSPIPSSSPNKQQQQQQQQQHQYQQHYPFKPAPPPPPPQPSPTPLLLPQSSKQSILSQSSTSESLPTLKQPPPQLHPLQDQLLNPPSSKESLTPLQKHQRRLHMSRYPLSEQERGCRKVLKEERRGMGVAGK
ncbi:hypothetical protein HDV05_007705, partial [Chytridiales sp. JEL 0842]